MLGLHANLLIYSERGHGSYRGFSFNNLEPLRLHPISSNVNIFQSFDLHDQKGDSIRCHSYRLTMRTHCF